MSPEIPVSVTASTEAMDAADALTYLGTPPQDGDVESGALMLGRRPIARLSRRRRPGVVPEPDGSILAHDTVWHAEAVGWLPDAGRPWDTRITRSAPTRRRAAEDVLRAYRNHR